MILTADQRAILLDVFGTLTLQEQEVLKMRCGIENSRWDFFAYQYTYTLEEVGRLLKVTQEHVRQVEIKALHKIRHSSRARKLGSLMRIFEYSPTRFRGPSPSPDLTAIEGE